MTTVAGQSFNVVICHECGAELSFQKGQSSRRAEEPDMQQVACAQCGHQDFYSAVQIRKARSRYLL